MQTSPNEVRKFELEVRLRDGSEREYDYKYKNAHVSAKVKLRDANGLKTTQNEHASVEETKRILAAVDPSPRMSERELLERARAALRMGDAIDHLEVEVEFADGTEIEAETGRELH